MINQMWEVFFAEKEGELELGMMEPTVGVFAGREGELELAVKQPTVGVFVLREGELGLTDVTNCGSFGRKERAAGTGYEVANC